MRHRALDELRVQHQQRVGGDGTLGRWACHSACYYRIGIFVVETDHPGLQHVYTLLTYSLALGPVPVEYIYSETLLRPRGARGDECAVRRMVRE